jgi:hypothetical protein
MQKVLRAISKSNMIRIMSFSLIKTSCIPQIVRMVETIGKLLM